jgi:hypothetical protein
VSASLSSQVRTVANMMLATEVVTITENLCAANGPGSSAGTSSSPSASAAAPANTQSSSSGAGRVGVAGALLAGAAVLAL